MPQDKEQLRFSVEESVWFQKGQEVSELLTISLEPDITIHEHDQYISIRGALQLTGEYKIDNEAKVQDQFEYANVRYVNEVSTREDGISILNHRFPVDITIPSNRIEDLNDVYVAIESFDYELPELKCLRLVADLSIGGITNEQPQQQVADEVESEEEEALEPLFRGEQQEETFEYDSQPSPPSFEQRPSNPFSSLYQEPETAEEDVDKLSLNHFEPVSQSEKETVTEEVSIVASIPRQEQNEELYVESNKEEEIHEEDLYDPFVVEVRKQEEIEEDTDGPPEVQYSLFSKAETLENSEIEEDVEEEREEESNPKDAHYLTSLFARDDEEDFSRVKMCIVQQGDTIELICERYDITVQQLMRVNDFHADQDVYEGQILYIPAYSTSK
ncbi:hypothetical protein WQ54_09890 [Bacillus sp. SA1-12]|uniref:stage VI sporulation protein D n=1 Tax=Bacillus sp. SA1-12 TaxID=1455638 RepID=UPI000626470D|nr:stage VI sporulation protein D [Bacillus sp. SA1-12]KKI92297.1 hypothetical protein WQ54_09890 [Bacillus sp. SA1-12]